MKILQTLEEVFEYSILRENNSDPKRKNLVKFHNILGYYSFVSAPIYSLIFLFLEANTIEQYAEAFYPLATVLCGGSIYVVFKVNRAQIFELIDDFNEIIESRKFALLCVLVKI